MNLLEGHMRNLLAVPLAVVVVAAAACGQSTNPTDGPLPQQLVSLNESVTLAVGEETAVDGTPLTIRFVEVQEDSRCPTGVDCAWEGVAVALLQVGDGTEQHTITLQARAGMRQSTGVAGYSLEIGALAPYPKYLETIDTGEYRLTLKVTPEA